MDPPLPGPLARGAVLIPYRVENSCRPGARGGRGRHSSPHRASARHRRRPAVALGDFSGTDTIVVVGLPPGPHKVLIALADPVHHILAGQSVAFTVPGPA